MAMNQADKDVVNVFPYFHIGGLFTCLQALHVGCTTFFIPIFDFKVFLRTIEKYRVRIGLSSSGANLRGFRHGTHACKKGCSLEGWVRNGSGG